MLDDDVWPLVFLLIAGLVIGGYFGIDYGQKFEIEKYCKWKYEKYVEVDACKEGPDYWKADNLDIYPKGARKSGSDSR